MALFIYFFFALRKWLWMKRKFKWLLKKSEFRIGSKVTETTSTIHSALGSESVSEHGTSSVEETRALKTRSAETVHQKLTMTDWHNHWSWPSYNYTRSCRRTQCEHSKVAGHLEQTGMMNIYLHTQWGPHHLTKKNFLKNCHFELSSFLF